MKTLSGLMAFVLFLLCGTLNAQITPYQTAEEIAAKAKEEERVKEGKVQTYESGENVGLNKQERLEHVDTFLSTQNSSLKNMEKKLDDNAKKIKDLESIIKALKEHQAKTDKALEDKIGEKANPTSSASKELPEAEKLKADILSLKNKDIEKLKNDLSDLSDTVKAIQATLKEQVK